jgi:hypothetical protein
LRTGLSSGDGSVAETVADVSSPSPDDATGASNDGCVVRISVMI